MERDSIIAHGAAFLVHERLMNSSDRHPAVICDKCGSMLSATAKQMTQQEAATLKERMPRSRIDGVEWLLVMCHVCKTSTSCHVIPMPYVTRYLVNELAAMNIKVTFDVEKISC